MLLDYHFNYIILSLYQLLVHLLSLLVLSGAWFTLTAENALILPNFLVWKFLER